MRITKCITCGIQLAYTEDYRNETTKTWKVCDDCEDDKSESQAHFNQNSIETGVQEYQETHVNQTIQDLQGSSTIRDTRLNELHTEGMGRVEALIEYAKLQLQEK